MPGFTAAQFVCRVCSGADSALEIIAAGKDAGAEQALKSAGGWRGRCGKTARRRAGDPRQAIQGDAWTGKQKRQPKMEPLKPLTKIEATMSFTIYAKGMVAQAAGSIIRRLSPR